MPDIEDKIELFCYDRHSGSAELAQTAFLILKDAVLNDPGFSIEKLTEIAGKLIRGQPSMAAVINIVNDICSAVEENFRKPDSITLFEGLNVIGNNITEENRATVHSAADVLSDYNRIATYSRSSLVESALIESGKKNPGQEIFLSESRPGNEGITLARNLSSKGIEVTVCDDAALPHRIEKCNVLVVGTDAVMPGRFSNKIGTSRMREAAVKADIPIYILAPRNKFLTGELAIFYQIEEFSNNNTLKLEGLGIYNRLFEWSNIVHIEEFIGGYGIISGEKLDIIFKNTEVADCLKNIDH